jgi:GNAT superfamily N-acetyltransferase
MEPITIRRAQAEDLQALLSFEQGVVNAERVFDPTLMPGPIHYYDIESMLACDEVQFLLAESGRLPVGCGYARLEAAEPYLQHRMHAYLGLMYVDPKYRGHAVNGIILDSLKQWCRSKGVTELRLEVYADNLAAIKAYEKAGFSRLVIEMRMGL